MKNIDKIRARKALVDKAQERDEKAHERADQGTHPHWRKRAFEFRASARRIENSR